MRIEAYASIRKQLKFEKPAIRLAAHLVVDGALAVAIYVTQVGKLYPLSQLLIPVLMFRAFALMHECVHGSVAKNKWVSDAVGVAAGAFCLLPFEPWKKIHLAHHRWSGNVDQDPSMGLIKKFASHSKAKNNVLNFFWRHWLPALALSQHFVFWSKSYQFILKTKSRSEAGKNAVSVLVPILLYSQINWIHNLPGLLAYLAMVEIINFPHHLRMPMLRGESSYTVREQYLTARSCAYPRWFAHHILNNFNLHVEHHLFPNLPWYQLAEARDLVKPVIGGAYTEIQGNRWIRENRAVRIENVFGTNFPKPEEKAA